MCLIYKKVFRIFAVWKNNTHFNNRLGYEEIIYISYDCCHGIPTIDGTAPQLQFYIQPL